ncbi:MAG: LysR family transcriptional regulator [Pseudomonadota bacterium]
MSSLRAFEAAARFGSFTDAASELGVTPAAISRSIRRLEEELGFDLFHRSHRAVSLTDDGARYAQQVTQGFRHFAPKSAYAAGQRATLTVEIEATFLRQWLMTRLNDEALHALGLSLRFQVHHDPPRVLPASSDLAIVWGYANYSGFRRKRLVSPRTVLVASPHLGVTELSQVAEAGLIHEADEHWWRLVYEEAGLPYPETARSLTLNRCDLPIAAARLGLGVAVGDDIIAESELSSGALVQVAGPQFDGQDYFLLTRTGASAPARNFAKWLSHQVPGALHS